MQLETERLILRPFRACDLEPFAEQNADPEVMAFFPNVMTIEQTQNLLSRIK